MNEAKFQWSINKPSTGEIFVVRGDQYEEWVLDIDKVKTSLLNKSKTIEEALGEKPMPKPTRMCPVHNMAMEQRWSEKKQKNYFAHVFNGQTCFGHE